jgi:hypothetical protein
MAFRVQAEGRSSGGEQDAAPMRMTFVKATPNTHILTGDGKHFGRPASLPYQNLHRIARKGEAVYLRWRPLMKLAWMALVAAVIIYVFVNIE